MQPGQVLLVLVLATTVHCTPHTSPHHVPPSASIGTEAVMSPTPSRAFAGQFLSSFQFSSSGPEIGCPMDSPRVIVVQRGQDARYLLGINMVADHGQHQTCTWKLVAPDGMVIQFIVTLPMDYRSSSSEDTLQFDDGVNMTVQDIQGLTTWSKNSTCLVRFHANPGSYGKLFVVSYLAVPKKECQGHPVVLDTSFQVENITVAAAPFFSRDTWDCRWLFKTNWTDALVRIEMDLKSFDAECPSVLYHAFDGALNDADRELTAQCRGSRTALYVSNNNTLLLTFRRDVWLDGADIKYQAVTPAS